MTDNELLTPLSCRAGIPFKKRVRITDGVNIWPTVDAFDLRMQIRAEPTFKSALKYDFTPHLQPSIDANDVVIDWYLTGEETKLLKSGFYDLIITDLGDEDARGFVVCEGPFTVRPVVSSSAVAP